MSNLSNNRLNTTATAAQITAVKTALQTISTEWSPYFIHGYCVFRNDQIRCKRNAGN